MDKTNNNNITARANTLKNIECSSGFFDRLNQFYNDNYKGLLK